MKKLLKNVLIKLFREGFTDRVLYIDNIPEDLFYELSYPRKVQMIDNKPNTQTWVSDITQPKVMALKEYIKLSQTGDKSLVFNLGNEQSSNLYAAVERYIKSVYPVNKVPANPKVNSVDPSNAAAVALAPSEVPRVELPVLSPSEQSDAGGSTASFVDIKKQLKQEILDEIENDKKQKVKERMTKARAARVK